MADQAVGCAQSLLEPARLCPGSAEAVPFDDLDLSHNLCGKGRSPVEPAAILNTELADVLAALRSLPAMHAAPFT
jgi:hypothetical protein